MIITAHYFITEDSNGRATRYGAPVGRGSGRS